MASGANFLGNKEIFAGQVPLVSGELAEDFTYYMVVFETTASCIGLSVLVILMSLTKSAVL